MRQALEAARWRCAQPRDQESQVANLVPGAGAHAQSIIATNAGVEAQYHAQRPCVRSWPEVLVAKQDFGSTAAQRRQLHAALLKSLRVEAQSRAALQAFASLTPVVASRIGGVGELVRAGETGWLVPPGDAIAYADAFCEILDGPEAAASITAGARQLAEASLRIDAKMAETLALYERLVAGKQPKGPAS